MRKKDTVPEHPLRAAQRKNAALRDEVRFLHEALFFTEILAAGVWSTAGCTRVGISKEKARRLPPDRPMRKILSSKL